MKRSFLALTALILLLALFGVTSAWAQEPEPVQVGEAAGSGSGSARGRPATQGPAAGSAQAGAFRSAAPVVEKVAWLPAPPSLTAEQQTQLAFWVEQTHRPGPQAGGAALAEVAGPTPGTASSLSLFALPNLAEVEEEPLDANELAALLPQPRAPGDFLLYRTANVDKGAGIPAGFTSNVMESSVGTGGRFVFFTGNWFAARSTKGGKQGTFNYVSPYSGMTDFCCDQVAIYDGARDMHVWLRMGSPSVGGGGNFENRFRLGASTNGGATFCNYDIFPTTINAAWTNQWWDYPHIQLGSDFLYISWNLFDWEGTPGTGDDTWAQTVMVRLDSDDLANCVAVGGASLAITDWFTFVPVQGAWHKMYWASNWPIPDNNTSLRIWTWDENTLTVSWVTVTIPAYTPTYRSSGQQCPGDGSIPAGNWTDRYDKRVLTGARYEINGTDVMYPGRKVLGWWWNVKQGGAFPQPYIEAAAVFEDTKALVPGVQARPLIWSSSNCFAYPSVTPNKRGDLGLIFHFGLGPDWNPDIGAGIADDFEISPPGFALYAVKSSQARPSDNKWGDYNTVREFEPTERSWVAGSHYINQTTNCSVCSRPYYFVFGRERDLESWNRWKKK